MLQYSTRYGCWNSTSPIKKILAVNRKKDHSWGRKSAGCISHIELLRIQIYSQSVIKNHTLISALHCCSLWQLLRLQNMPEQLVRSRPSSPLLSSSILALCEGRGDWTSEPSCPSASPHGSSSLHLQVGRADDGNGLQVNGQTSSEETAATRLRLISDLLRFPGESTDRVFRMHGLQNVSDELDFSPSVGVLGNLVNDIIPFRQRGHETDPGGPVNSTRTLVVEQR
jgi:hypothetical protein